ncbi:MAG TPA: ABC transporter permease [Bryobacteraceae bacterium]|jgi:predicted permease|nr:ABC transporter permease [Bryobacteraceae bacterium]
MEWNFRPPKQQNTDRRNTDLDDEIAHDLALDADERIRSGAAPREAELASRRDFGNVGLLKEGIREMWGWTSLERFGRDLRYAWRGLRNSPLFASMAVLSLALGIGANTAIFSVINAILLRPLPGVEHASELVTINEKFGAGNGPPMVSYPDYRDFRDRNSVLSGLAAIGFVPASVGPKGNCQRMFGYTVSGNYFDLLGVKPLAGRLIQPEDDKVRGGHPVLVLSYTGWQKFGGDPNIIGTKLQVNGREFTVLGVTPKGFIGTELFFAPDAFFSIAMHQALGTQNADLDSRSGSGFFAVGRLKRGFTMAQAEWALDAIGRQLAQEYPQVDGGMRVKLSPPGLAGAWLRGPVIGFAAALFGVSCLVLLVACVNLASMLLARARDKRKETAIRLALGAGRGVLIRQLLTENLMVALAGGAAGALLAVWITNALAAWHPPGDMPVIVNVPVDFSVFLFALGVSTVTTLLFGLLPALQATKTDLVPALKNAAAAARFRYWHLRDYMVAAQVAMSVLLLFCSVLVVKSLQRSLDAPIGFEPRGLATVSFDLEMQGYDEPRGRDFQRRILDKVRQLPGVESAALVDRLPLTMSVQRGPVYIEGKPLPKRPADAPSAYGFSVTPDYFHTMRTRLISGRDFDDRDKDGGNRVAIVTSSFAAELLDGANPLGRRFSTGPSDKPMEIVGVVENGKYYSLTDQAPKAFWTPLEVSYGPKASLMARTRMIPPESLVPSIRAVVREIDPSIALFSAGSMQDQLSLTLFPARIAAIALSAFGMLALVLAATGIYAVMAYAVSRRTREIGIRMAIGATQAQVLGSVARGASILIGTGLVLGLGMALLAGGLLERILYGVKPSDPVTFAIVFAIMLAIGAAATSVPARRAARIDPMQALRLE